MHARMTLRSLQTWSHISKRMMRPAIARAGTTYVSTSMSRAPAQCQINPSMTGPSGTIRVQVSSFEPSIEQVSHGGRNHHRHQRNLEMEDDARPGIPSGSQREEFGHDRH